MLKSEPEMLDGCTNKKPLDTWKVLRPLSIEEILDKSKVEFDIEDDELEFKRVDFDQYCYEIGMFRRGTRKAHGISRFVNKDGVIFEGLNQEGQLNGFARALNEEGAYFQGIYKNGYREGFGRNVAPDGKVQEGEWKQSKYIGD